MDHLNDRYSGRDRLMLRVAILLAFFGLLRSSEFTSPTTTWYDPRYNLSASDIDVVPGGRVARIRIKASKTDPFRMGAVIRIGATNNSLCPVSAVYLYLQCIGPRQGPLFTFCNNRFLMRRHVAAVLHASLPGALNIRTHSLRIGGASTMASRHIPDGTIQIMGRWRSNAYRRYIHFTDEFVAGIHRAMAGGGLDVTRVWDADSLVSTSR